MPRSSQPPASAGRNSDGRYQSIAAVPADARKNLAQWQPEQLARALYARLKEKLPRSFNQLSEDFVIPVSTLKDWHARLVDSEEYENFKSSPRQKTLLDWIIRFSHGKKEERMALTERQEQQLVSLIVARAEAGKPMRQIAIREEAARIRDGRTEEEQRELLERVFISNDLEIPMLSRCWMLLFLARWKQQLSTRAPSSLTKARALGLNKASVSQFYDRIEAIITSHGVGPDCIANFDEKGFEGEGEDSNRVVVPSHFHHSDVIRGAYRDHWSVGVCVFANGFAVPPAVAYKGKRFPPSLMSKLPTDSIACVQENGYFTQDTFPDILKHINYHRPNKEKPVLLVLDNSDTHLEAGALEVAKSLNILLEFLPPNCTHRLQPLDVSFFAPMSKSWVKAVRLFQNKSPDVDIGRYQLGEIFTWTWNHTNKEKSIINGFAKTGISPLDRKKIEEWEFKTRNSPPVPPTAPVVQPASEAVAPLQAELADMKSMLASVLTQMSELREEFRLFRESAPAAAPAKPKQARAKRPPMLKSKLPALVSIGTAEAQLEAESTAKKAGRKRQTRAKAGSNQSNPQPAVAEKEAEAPPPKRSKAAAAVDSEDEPLLDLTQLAG